MNIKKRVVVAIIATQIMGTSVVNAGAAAGGASEVTQIVQMITDIIDRYLGYIKQVEELKAKMKMVKKNVENMTNPKKLLKQSVEDLIGLYGKQTDLLEAARVMTEDYGKKYEGYVKYVQEIKKGKVDFKKVYNDLSDDLRENGKITMRGIAKNLEYYADIHGGIMDKLADMNRNPEGQTKAIQATNEALYHLINISTKFHQTLMLESKMQSEYRAMQEKRRDMDRAHIEANHDIPDFTKALSKTPDV